MKLKALQFISSMLYALVPGVFWGTWWAGPWHPGTRMERSFALLSFRIGPFRSSDHRRAEMKSVNLRAKA